MTLINRVDNHIAHLSSIECWKQLENLTNSYLIDVRSPEEWQETGIADLSLIDREAKTISWKRFTPFVHQNDKFLDELSASVPDKKAHLFFICKSGGRSLQAANSAKEAGYQYCYNVNDGFEGNMFNKNLISTNINGWMNSNLPRKKL